MTQNVGKVESYVRIGLGALAGLAALRFVKSRPARGLLSAVALSGLQSGIMRQCAVKKLFGLGSETPEKLSGPKGSTYDRSSFDNSAIPTQSQAV